MKALQILLLRKIEDAELVDLGFSLLMVGVGFLFIGLGSWMALSGIVEIIK